MEALIVLVVVVVLIVLVINWLGSLRRKPSILIRYYKNEKAFRRDADRLSRRNYIVSTVTNQQPRAGCMRLLTLGIFTLIFPPKPMLVVTYRLQVMVSMPA